MDEDTRNNLLEVHAAAEQMVTAHNSAVRLLDQLIAQLVQSRAAAREIARACKGATRGRRTPPRGRATRGGLKSVGRKGRR